MALVSTLDAILAVTRKIATSMSRLGGIAVFASAFMITADVILRRTLGVSSWGADEYSYYILAISTSWALSYTLLSKAHIRIDAFSSLFSVTARAWFDVVALLSLSFMSIYASQAIWGVFFRSFRRGTASLTTLGTPMWIPQGLFFAGYVFFCFVAVLMLARVLVALLVQRDAKLAGSFFGAVSQDEEMHSALEEARALNASETAHKNEGQR